MVNSSRPLILIRGFGGPDVQDEQRDAYQGFNNGTVYPKRRGENYIYEGFVLRALKSGQHPYRDATNVVGYYAEEQSGPTEHDGWPEHLLSGTMIVDVPMAEEVLRQGAAGTLWIYRYYDLLPRTIHRYGEGLVRLIEIIRHGMRGEEFTGVDIVAHSMGGLVARAALSQLGDKSEELIHRIVTLGTPHRGIAFQYMPDQLVKSLPGSVADEIAAFDPDRTDIRAIPFPTRRILTVVGTDHRSYSSKFASLGNRVATLIDDGTLSYNRSDGLVKQASAQIPGAPRAFVHKCHGGRDSLVTSREAYEIAMRFLHGTHFVRLRLDKAEVTRGRDLFGRSEFYFGVSVKPRFIDFDLFHQSSDAENYYGPFRKDDFTDELPDLAEELSKPLSASGDATTGWAGENRLIWEGWVNASAKPEGMVDKTVVLRLDVHVCERDTLGIGFSDNLVFRKQYYVQAVPEAAGGPRLYLHTGERFLAPGATAEEVRAAAEGEDPEVQRMEPTDEGQPGTWTFKVGGTGFTADLLLSVTDERTS
ncbi:lipase family alpha/beta hydrolase [Streptomyces sp. NPDC057474]|uniref:lipase family alpha/beta hydrolase n=1 Tax=Streptomyces sp. NPDC057474 TaxID=3346144 RepID=UPI00368C3483